MNRKVLRRLAGLFLILFSVLSGGAIYNLANNGQWGAEMWNLIFPAVFFIIGLILAIGNWVIDGFVSLRELHGIGGTLIIMALLVIVVCGSLTMAITTEGTFTGEIIDGVFPPTPTSTPKPTPTLTPTPQIEVVPIDCREEDKVIRLSIVDSTNSSRLIDIPCNVLTDP